MRAVVQRVTHAKVEVDGAVVGEIGSGLLVLLGVAKGDGAADADFLAKKIPGLRIFSDNAGKMNLSLKETGGALLAVSQFTLYGDCSKGRRPGFDLAAPADQARALYEHFVAASRREGVRVETGVFQAHMAVSLVNDGPVTLIVESPPLKPAQGWLGPPNNQELCGAGLRPASAGWKPAPQEQVPSKEPK